MKYIFLTLIIGCLSSKINIQVINEYFNIPWSDIEKDSITNLDLANGFSLIFGVDLGEAKDSLVQFGIVSWEHGSKKNPAREEINAKNMAPMICECFEGLRYYLGDKERVSLPKSNYNFSIYLSGFIRHPG